MKKDEGQELTDKALAELEKKIAAVYKKAEIELKPEIDAYFKQFEEADMERLMEEGEKETDALYDDLIEEAISAVEEKENGDLNS